MSIAQTLVAVIAGCVAIIWLFLACQIALSSHRRIIPSLLAGAVLTAATAVVLLGLLKFAEWIG